MTRVLADESIDRPLVVWLRSRGHDVAAICEESPQAEDVTVLERSVAEGRVLLTADKDFGDLIFAERRHAIGVVLLRIDVASPRGLLDRFATAWNLIESSCVGRFHVVTSDRVRVRPLP